MQLEFRNINNQSSYTYDAGAVEKGEKTASGQGKTEGEVSSAAGVVKETNPNTIRALEAANIAVNDSTVEMVESMMKEGLRIDKESLQNMYRLLLRNPDVSSEQLVKMNALEIDVTPENIRQFQVYENLSHQLTGSFKSLSDSVFQVASDLFENGQNGQAFQVVKSGLIFADGSQMQQSILDGMERLDNVNKELLDMVDSLKGSGDTILYAGKEGAVTELFTRISDALEALKVSDTILENGEIGQVNPETGMPVADGKASDMQMVNGESANVQQMNPDVISMQASKGESVNIQQLNPEEVGTQSAKASDSVMQFVITETEGIKQANEGNVHVQTETATAGRNENLLNNQIRSQINNGAEQLQNIAKHVISRIQQGNEIPEMAELAEKIERFVKDSLFGRKQLANELKQTVAEGLLLRPEDVADAKSMNEYFDKLMTKMEQMTNVLRDAGVNQTPLNQNVTSMTENIQFMNQLNQVFQYVQLPLKMSNKNTSGDLYVYSNKKNLMDNDGNISAFVHLDMDYIGPLDVYIRMSKGMKVATDFYLKDEETLDFIGEHIHLLNERLAAKGYVIDTNLSVKEEKKEKSVMEHMMDKKAMSVRTKLLSVNSFDTLA